jgi:hypothetical protein
MNADIWILLVQTMVTTAFITRFTGEDYQFYSM